MPLFPDLPTIGPPSQPTGGPKPPGLGAPAPDAPDLLESEFKPDYDLWKQYQNPTANGRLLKTIEPVIQTAVKTYAGGAPSPTLVSKARLMALQAMPNYDPKQAKLKTYLMNHLQGLRRVAARDNQILAVPEQVQLDHYHLHRAETELRDQMGRDPSTAELADHTGISMRRIAYVRKLRPALSDGQVMTPIAGSESDDFNEPAVRAGGKGEAKAWHRFVYDSLDATDQVIMEHSLGLRGKPILSNQEIARKLGVTPSAVSQRKARIQGRLDERSSIGLL